MPISSFPASASRSYLPKPLPLTGSNYHVTIRNSNPAKQKNIQKAGDRVTVRGGNPADNIDLQVRPDGLSYQKMGQLPTHIRQQGQSISIQRPNGQNVQIVKRGNSILVDRPGVSNDVQFTQTSNGLDIDRYSVHNDVRITSTAGAVSFQYGQPQKNTQVNLPTGMDFDPVAFQQETTLHPHGFAILNEWFSHDSIDAADLVTLTQKGDMVEADDLLR
jgi:hypothetical protein